MINDLFYYAVSNVKVLEASTKASFQNTDSGAAAQLGPNGLRALNFISSDNDNDDVYKKYSIWVASSRVML